jgi:hypothetical protein
MPKAPRRPIAPTNTDFGDLNVYDIERYIDHLLHEQWQREQTAEGKERARRAREFMQRSGIRPPAFGEEEDPRYSWHSGLGGEQYKGFGTGPERNSKPPLPHARQPEAPEVKQKEYERKEREWQRNAPPPPDVDGWSPQYDYDENRPASYHDLSKHEQAVLGALIARKLFGAVDVTPGSDKVFQLDPNAKAPAVLPRDDRKQEATRAMKREQWQRGNTPQAQPQDDDPYVDDFYDAPPKTFSRRGQTE